MSLAFGDPALVAISGKARHTMARFTGRSADVVCGTVFAVTAGDIQNAVKYEVAAVMRVAVVLRACERGRTSMRDTDRRYEASRHGNPAE